MFSLKKILLDITNLDEEHKSKLRGLIRACKKNTNNLEVFVKQDDKVNSCGAIFANAQVIKQFEEVVKKENIKFN